MKESRQKMIVELINEFEIETQEELSRLLLERGYVTTQATISRDIKDLNIKKIPGKNGRAKYAIPAMSGKTGPDSGYLTAIKGTVLSVEAAENIIVVKTAAGMAMAAAAAIDSMNIEHVLGCIAGDDTIMCVVKSVTYVDNVVKELSTLLAKI